MTKESKSMSKTIQELSRASDSRENKPLPASADAKYVQNGNPLPSRKYNEQSLLYFNIEVILFVLIGSLSVASIAISLKAVSDIKKSEREISRYIETNRLQKSEQGEQLAGIYEAIATFRMQNNEYQKTVDKKIDAFAKNIKENESNISKLSISNNSLRAYINDFNRVTSEEINKLKSIK